MEKKEFKLSTILGWFDQGIGKNEARKKLYEEYNFNKRTVNTIMSNPKVIAAKVNEPLQIDLYDDTEEDLTPVVDNQIKLFDSQEGEA